VTKSDIEAAEFERVRLAGIRTFTVRFVDEKIKPVTVRAHMHDAGGSGGTIAFHTILPTGQQTIADVFPTQHVLWVHEEIDEARVAAVHEMINRPVPDSGNILVMPPRNKKSSIN
jgi:hypothetical protein